MNSSTHELSQRVAEQIATKFAEQYLRQSDGAWFDPFHKWRHFVIAFTLLALLVLVFWNWRVLLNFISEDNVLRCDRFCLQYWCFLQCCGLCDGEWTRCVSSGCCCCCPSVRGRNLKRMLGEWLGLSPVPIRVQNIVLGGLPRSWDSWFTQRSPDLFVEICPDELQPTLNTEVVTQANIDCVQFTSGFTLMVKNNIREDPVRICVREMRLVGGRDIADCYLCPTRLVAWAEQGRKVRVRLSPMPGQSDPQRTPWILMDLSIPGEMRYLRAGVGSFSPIVMETTAKGFMNSRDVGIREQSVDEELELGSSGGCISPSIGSCLPGRCSGQRGQTLDNNPTVLLPVRASSDFRMYSKFPDFTDRYPLLDPKGFRVMETEDTLGRGSLRLRGYIRTSLCVLITISMAYLAGRFVTTTCSEEYRQMQVEWRYAQEHPREATDTAYYTRRVEAKCRFFRLDIAKFATSLAHHRLMTKMLKRSLGVGGNTTVLKDICNPSPEETIKFCAGPNISGTPRVFQMLNCHPYSCWVDVYLQDLDAFALALFALWVAAVCLGRCWVENRMREALQRPTRENFLELYNYLAARAPGSPPSQAEEVQGLVSPSRRPRVGMGGGIGFGSPKRRV